MKNKTFATRAFTLILAALLVGGSLVSCGKDNPDTPTPGTSAPTTGSDTSAEVVTEPAETRLDPNLPDMNLDGYKITFFGKTATGIYAEEETGDRVNDSVYARNRALNEKYNFEVELIAAGNQEFAITEGFQTVSAGEDAYQVLVDGGNRYVQFIQAGLMTDMNTLKYQDFEQPWWYKYLNEGLSIQNRLYMTASAFMLTTKSQLYGTVINRKLAEDNNVDIAQLYQWGRDGKWTIDRFAELTKLGNEDLNGDGVRDYNDQWGLQMEAYCGYALSLGCGFRIAEKDENDVPYISAGTEEAINIWDRLNSLLFSDHDSVLITQNIAGVTSTWATAGEMWAAGRVLVGMSSPVSSWRDREYDYCILPAPKLTEEQAQYCHTGSSWNTPLLGVPVTVVDKDKVSFILEAMSYTSYYDVLPDFYENYLQTRLMRDKESVEMLEIIQSTPYFDIGAVFTWGDYLGQTYTITRSGTNNMATYNAKAEKAATATINKFLKQLEKNEAKNAG